MNITRKSVADTVISLLEVNARRATTYLDEKTVVTATRRHKPDKRNRHTEILLKLGGPNYREREFIAACKKAGESFPVKKIQFRFWNKKK